MFLLFFVGLDDEPPSLGVVLERLEPTWMVDELGGSDGFGSKGDDGGVLINGDGWMTFSGFGSIVLGILLLDFWIEFVVLGVFMVS